MRSAASVRVCDDARAGVRGEGEGANTAARTDDQRGLSAERLEQLHQGEPGAAGRWEHRREGESKPPRAAKVAG
jgi:hypothetical protein